MTQATSAAKPTLQTAELNGKSIYRFDGTDDYCSLPTMGAFTEGMAFVVIKIDADPPAAGAQTGMWNFDGAADNHYPWTDGSIYDAFGTNTRKSTGNPAASLASWRFYTVLSKSGEWTSWIDEAQHFTTGTNTTAFSTGPKFGTGTSAATNYFLDGDVAELVLCSADVGATDRQAVWDYFQSEYAL
jgi:hypothetical protein